MSANENNLGVSLYGDAQITSRLTPSAQIKFNKYIKQLNDLSKRIQINDGAISPWQKWEYGLRQLYKGMIFDAFKELNITIPPKMEIHFSDTLTTPQATKYSDLDAFVIVEHEQDVAIVQRVFDALSRLYQRIFKENTHLYPDPIGINPHQFIGTLTQLYTMLKEKNAEDIEAITQSMLASKPILPHHAFREQLRAKIKNNRHFKKFCSAEKFYHIAIHDFTEPNPEAQNISIKLHIMRPIDFILIGLREEFDLYSEDGAHLSAPGTIRLLRERKRLPDNDIACIASVYNQAMAKKFQLHAEHKKEWDKMPRTEAADMLAKVTKLRNMVNERVKRLNTASSSQDPEKIEHHPKPPGTLKKISVILLILLVTAAAGVCSALEGGLTIPQKHPIKEKTF